MSDLPWAIAPRQQPPRRIGNESSGVLEVPVFGGLTVQEAATVSELLAGDVTAFVAGAQAADAIAQAEGITVVEAFSIVEKSVSGIKLEDEQAESIRLRHAERIDSVAAIYHRTGQSNMEASVTAIIRHRLDRPAWSLGETRKLPQVLLQGIWQLIIDEQAAEKMPAEKATEEELKKPLPATGKRRKQTGPASSGACAMPTPAPSTVQGSVVS